ncbi:MAG: UDP-3-O-(3-hydroxymyristoyl)glucosamine N-acyltransferase [Bacteroidales bacterium]|nr:UDP-3-O-(3-hydroxymyristoyl)glucosamine N-acyltransferase [Bacteroidales bacterium]
MELTARKLAQILGGTVDGNPDATAGSFARIENGKPGSISFFANPKYEQYVYTSRASILLVNSDFEPKEALTPTLVRVPDAYTAVAALLKYVADQKKTHRRHRGRSRIAFSARIGKRVWIGDYCTVGAHSSIGDDCIIKGNVSIGENTVIGRNCLIYPGVRIYPGTVIGNNVILHENAVIGSDGFGNAPQPDGTWQKIEHLGNVVIGDDVEIGSCTTVDRAQMESTIIGNGVRIDNLCMIAHNVRIGDNTVMAAQTGIAGSTKVGRNCIFAGQVGIVGHLEIADNTTIGAQAGVLGNVRKPGQKMMGSPAIQLGTFLRAYARFKQNGE